VKSESFTVSAKQFTPRLCGPNGFALLAIHPMNSGVFHSMTKEQKKAYDHARHLANPRRYYASKKAWIKANPSENAKRMRNWRRANPIKSKAHQAVWNALNRGHIVKPLACQLCNAAGPVQAHHSDYTLKLDVLWLCNGCHLKQHGKQVRL
jgi:hypothetical protein